MTAQHKQICRNIHVLYCVEEDKLDKNKHSVIILAYLAVVWETQLSILNSLDPHGNDLLQDEIAVFFLDLPEFIPKLVLIICF